MNYFFSRNYKDLNSAGNKAKTDIENIMLNMGFQYGGLHRTTYRNSVLHFLMTLFGVAVLPFKLHKGDNLVVQYPLKKYFTMVCKLAHLKGTKVIVVIHDLGSFRRKALTPAQEINRLNHADHIIAHNERMKQWIADHGCTAQLHTLGIFDYLSATEAPTRHTPQQPYTVVYAGGLNRRKNAFLYEWGKYIKAYRVSLYGNGFEVSEAQGSDKFQLMGFTKSDQLIATAKGDFGLVWDGASVNGCTGNFGEYLKFNNPHKTSLYIRCGLPVIIWRQAALATFVEQQGIGLCINSLEQLDTLLQNLTAEQYDRMRTNVMKTSHLLQQGHYFTTAVSPLL